MTLNIPNTVSTQLQSPRYPSTPASGASNFTPFNEFYPRHSRSNSSGSNPRSASPAASVASALTSVSSSASQSNTQTFATFPHPSIITPPTLPPTRPKQRKQRLFNVDRKAICVFHRENPQARQEDIAIRYGVERSTISKILKNKTKWLNIHEEEGIRVAKHR